MSPDHPPRLSAARRDYDVVVIGGGVAGSLIAYQLVRRGVQVLVLEAGERVEQRRTLVEQYARSPSKQPSAPYIGFVAPQPYASDARRPLSRVRNFGGDYFVQNRNAPLDRLYMSDYVSLAGGSTWHWQGLWVRMVPNDFQMQSVHTVGRDWPSDLSYDVLEPWYSRAEQLLGVAGDDAAHDGLHGAKRGEAFPQPAIPPSYGDQLFMKQLEGASFDGVPLRITTIPQAKNSQPYDGRPACEGRTSCVPLCPIQAKYEARVHLERAEQLGAETLTRAVVTKLTAASDGRIERVAYRRWDGTATAPTGWADYEVSGRVVVLAANGIESPKLLLHSRLGGDHVGRHLMDHPIKMAWALASEPVFPFRGPPSTSGIEVLRDGPFRRERGAFRTSFRNDGWAVATGAPRGHSLAPSAEPDQSLGTVLDFVGNRGLFGTALVAALREHASRQVLVGSSVEMLPRPENRIDLDSNRKDRLGIPRPRIQFAIDDYTRGALRASDRLHQHIFDLMGVSERHSFGDAAVPDGGAGHAMGTTIMGDSPSDSVVDADCRAHGHVNLFVVGGSVFPTSSAANPTATVAALALRAADTILRDLGGVPAFEDQ